MLFQSGRIARSAGRNSLVNFPQQFIMVTNQDVINAKIKSTKLKNSLKKSWKSKELNLKGLFTYLQARKTLLLLDMTKKLGDKLGLQKKESESIRLRQDTILGVTPAVGKSKGKKSETQILKDLGQIGDPLEQWLVMEELMRKREASRTGANYKQLKDPKKKASAWLKYQKHKIED